MSDVAKITLDGFKRRNEEKIIKNYDGNSDKRYKLEVDFEYPKRVHDSHSDLSFSPERMKVRKCHELVCKSYDKKKYVLHIRTLIQALNHGLTIKRVQREIELN